MQNGNKLGKIKGKFSNNKGQNYPVYPVIVVGGQCCNVLLEQNVMDLAIGLCFVAAVAIHLCSFVLVICELLNRIQMEFLRFTKPLLLILAIIATLLPLCAMIACVTNRHELVVNLITYHVPNNIRANTPSFFYKQQL